MAEDEEATVANRVVAAEDHYTPPPGVGVRSGDGARGPAAYVLSTSS